MPSPVLQPSLAGGELAPSLYSRVDLNRYLNSLKTCRNFITQVFGGAKNRPGYEFMAEAKFRDKKVRLIPFVFNQDQAYVLELSDYSLRAYTDGSILAGATNKPNNGTMVPTDLGSGNFTLTALKDTFVPGDVGRKISVFQAVLDTYTITAYTDAKNVTATSTASLSGLTLAPTDTWLFVENPDGAVTFETSTPWSESMLADLNYSQQADVITVCHPDVQPHDIRRLSDGTFQVQKTSIINGPFLDANADASTVVAASAVTGTITLTASRPIFRSVHVGCEFYIEQVYPGTLWKAGATVSSGDVRLSDGKYYRAMSGGTAGTVAPTHFEGTQSDGTINWLYLHSGFGTCTITAIGTLTNGFASTATAVVNGQLPDGTVPSYTTATVTSYAISPANSGWVRATTSAAHGFSDYASVNYTA